MTAAEAYPLSQRQAHAESHILAMAALHQLEVPISRHVAATYGLPESFVQHLKALKARLRNELCFGDGK